MNPFSLKDKCILVTGASSGIGQQVAITLSLLGAKVLLTARNKERLISTMQILSGDGHRYIICNLTENDDLNNLVESISVLDGLVCCAGINEYIPAKFVNSKKAENIFNTNYFSHIFLTQKLIKGKKINKGASLVFISSVSSLLGVPATLLYASSKAAINASVRVLASELAPQKIRVNAICPGIIRTPMIEENNELDINQFNEQEKLYPLGLGTPEDVANAVAFYLSDLSRWLTGNLMVLDGGFTLQ